jgi:hypothetical protein
MTLDDGNYRLGSKPLDTPDGVAFTCWRLHPRFMTRMGVILETGDVLPTASAVPDNSGPVGGVKTSHENSRRGYARSSPPRAQRPSRPEVGCHYCRTMKRTNSEPRGAVEA